MRFPTTAFSVCSTHVRILIVEDDPFDRQAVQRVVTRAGHCATAAADGLTAVALAARHVYDVALVDLGMGGEDGMDGFETLRELRKVRPYLRLVVVSGREDRPSCLRAVSAGADGYVLKRELRRLPRALVEARAGEGPMSAGAARHVLAELRRATDAGEVDVGPDTLTARQLQVLELLSHSHSYTYRELATELGVTMNTVRHHIRNLYRRLGASSKTEAVKLGRDGRRRRKR